MGSSGWAALDTVVWGRCHSRQDPRARSVCSNRETQRPDGSEQPGFSASPRSRCFRLAPAEPRAPSLMLPAERVRLWRCSSGTISLIIVCPRPALRACYKACRLPRARSCALRHAPREQKARPQPRSGAWPGRTCAHGAQPQRSSERGGGVDAGAAADPPARAPATPVRVSRASRPDDVTAA